MAPNIHNLKRKIVRMLYSLVDFRHAQSAVTFLIQDVTWEKKYKIPGLRRFKCYEAMAIIAFCRPFVPTRGKTTLGLKELGVELNDQDRELRDRLMTLRNKLVAHSDEDWMHFRVDLIEFEGEGIKMPHLQSNEGLLLSYEDLMCLSELIHKCVHAIAKFTFDLAQENPGLLEMYKRPT